jgi:hypothetical protein
MSSRCRLRRRRLVEGVLPPLLLPTFPEDDEEEGINRAPMRLIVFARGYSMKPGTRAG